MQSLAKPLQLQLLVRLPNVLIKYKKLFCFCLRAFVCLSGVRRMFAPFRMILSPMKYSRPFHDFIKTLSLLWSLQHTSHCCLTNFKLSSFKYRIIATFSGTFSFFCYDSCCLKSKTGIKANNICSICIRKSIH